MSHLFNYTEPMRDAVVRLAEARTESWKRSALRSQDRQILPLHTANVRGAYGELYVVHHLLESDWEDWIRQEIAIAESSEHLFVGSADVTIDHGEEWDRTKVDIKTSSYLPNGLLPNLLVRKKYAKPGVFHAWVGVAVDPYGKCAEYVGWCTDKEVFTKDAAAFGRKLLRNDEAYLIKRGVLRTDLDWITKPLGVRLNVART